MKSSFGKAFTLFEVILSVVIANVLLVLGSVFSLFLLFPALLISTLYYLRRMYLYHEYTGIVYNYMNYLRGNVLKPMKMIFPLVLFIGLLLFSIFYYNQAVTEVFHPFFVWLIFLVQLFMLYQAVGVMVVASILYAQNSETPAPTLLNKAFIIFNAHPFRALFSMISLFAGIVFVIRVFPFSYLVLFPVGLFLFYVVFSDAIEQKQYV